MIKNFKYFFYGCPDKGQLDSMYALYQPAADAFLICTTNWRTAYKLRMILSSRYNLHLVELTKAKNYQYNIIDNDVCENWSFTEKNLLSYTNLLQEEPLLYARELCSSTNTLDINWFEEKKYAMMCAYWIEFFYINTHSNRRQVFQSKLAKCIGYADFPEIINETETQVMKTLYLGHGAEETDIAIRKIINAQ